MTEVNSINKQGDLAEGTELDIKINGNSILIKAFVDVQFPIIVPVGKVLKYELRLNLFDAEPEP